MMELCGFAGFLAPVLFSHTILILRVHATTTTTIWPHLLAGVSVQ